MSDVTKHESTNGHGSYEHQDLQASGIVYFLLTLAVVTVICLFGIRTLYSYLDRRERVEQPAVNPLVTNVPADTRHIAPGYPQAAFPSPRLEENERDQLNGFLAGEQQQLYTYGWVDQKAGIMHIPIERAMDLLVQRGLPVRPQGAGGETGATKPPNQSQQSVTGTKGTRQ
jgi:hypothetical protein